MGRSRNDVPGALLHNTIAPVMRERPLSVDAYLNLADPDEDAIAVRQGEERVVSEQPKKVKNRRLVKQSHDLPAKKLRTDHPSLASGTSGKTLANLEQIMPEGSHLLAREQPVAPSVVPPCQEGEGFVDLSAQGSYQDLVLRRAATDVGPSHPEESLSSDNSFYEIPNVDPAMAKRWFVPKWNITNDSLLDDAFSCRTLADRVSPPAFFSDLHTMGYDQLFIEFNVRAVRQICLGSELLAVRDGDWCSLGGSPKLAEYGLCHLLALSPMPLRLASGLGKSLKWCTEAGDKIVSFDVGTGWLISEAGLEAGHEHGSAGRSLSVVDAYNPEAAKANCIDAVKALEDVDFRLVNLLKSKKDAGMDEVLDCFLLDGPSADLPEAGAKKHVAALRKIMIDIVSDPLSFQTWVGEASTSAAPLSVKDYLEEDTDEALGSVVSIPQLEVPYL
ncbi:hypothetical protein Tco_0726676 [Tanacetum coccineum]|uniref:Uncharacterized protein n=1 Tax=Tanacetum coccineum TaxID=301880 RepID=A0ABQ4YIJ7_9ASTR